MKNLVDKGQWSEKGASSTVLFATKMPSLFRSESMTRWQIFLQLEIAYDCLAALGELGIAHMIDLNPDVNPFQRKFYNEVKRCDDMEKKLLFIENESLKNGIKLMECDPLPPAPDGRQIIDLEAVIDRVEEELREVNANVSALERNFVELKELQQVLLKSAFYFDECVQQPPYLQEIVTQDNLVTTVKLSFIAGVIHNERVPAFERMLWRVCQGNAYLRLVPIEEELIEMGTLGQGLGNYAWKSVFIIFFQGEQYKARVKKICEGFRTSLYHLPDTAAEREEMVSGVQVRLADLAIVLDQSRGHRHRLLTESNIQHHIQYAQVRKMKAIYHALNNFNVDVTQMCLIGECWVPDYAENEFITAFHNTHSKTGSSVAPVLNPLRSMDRPPTLYRTNKFSGSFQVIVDSYGVATYRELNPAYYATITFPFLFAVMFGDAGHGILMTLFAAYLCIFEKSIIAKKIKEEMFTTIFSGRYIILMMGLFSMYTGLIYNDVFSKSVNIFGTQWGSNYSTHELMTNKILQLNPASDGNNFYGEPYYFGVDPIWQMGTNKLNYLDSYKMKLSVILGVIHMMFGVIIGIFNHVYFKRWHNIFLEWIPEIIFLGAMFGYLDMLIIWKWFKYSPDDSGSAPNLLINLINMYLGKDDELPMYDSQKTVEMILVIVAIVCVPWMLLIKPFVLRCLFNRAAARGTAKYEFPDVAGPDGHFEMGEVFVHQAIHTIEYCLGCISNTASYLRLWALSLAHNQLSDVLWTLVMRMGFTTLDNYYGGGAILWAIFAFWAVLTIGILLIMEGLSAFLHALRLHWVEFMNKFYVGEGYVFAPFSFKRTFSEEEI